MIPTENDDISLITMFKYIANLLIYSARFHLQITITIKFTNHINLIIYTMVTIE